ncbi:HD domain-containing protein [Agrobacterium vitis]|uniref:HD domain-containing protein n=1 Tax=Agrobacterium vitis TaxID=373 RepID=UPI0018D253E5|nr:HD domain-containing protein [Agrobacterium vitis]
MKPSHRDESKVEDDVTPRDPALSRARRVAAQDHEGQRDKQGLPYISHCERVASRVADDDTKIVALLHDCLEKGEGWTSTALCFEGFSADIIASVEALTRRPDESDQSFLNRIASDRMASTVKIVDLEDNIEQCRSAGLDETPYQRSRELFVGIVGTGFPSRAKTQYAVPKHDGVVRSLLVELGISDAIDVDRH